MKALQRNFKAFNPTSRLYLLQHEGNKMHKTSKILRKEVDHDSEPN